MKNCFLLLTFFILNITNANSQCVNDLYLGFGGSAADEGKAIVTDVAGNAYITGTFINAIQLGNVSVTTTDSIAMFLAKLDQSGNVVWAKEIISGFSSVSTTILRINAAGQLLMAGTCENPYSDFDTLIQPFTLGNIYVAKFNLNDGALLSFISMANHGYSWLNDFTTDNAGNAFVTGGFVGPVSFGPFNMICTGTTNTFIAKFDDSNQAIWAKRVTNNLTSGNWGNKIGLDGGQHIYVTGAYGISCDFGNGNTLSSNDYSNGYLSKLDTAGNVIWARTSIPGETHFHQVVIDSSSIIVVRESPATLVNYNQHGDTVWTKSISNNSYNLFREVICFNGHLFTLGSLNNSILLGDSTCNIGGNNIFIARFGLDGTFDWLKPVHSSYNAFPTAFDIDTSGNFHITGAYQGTDTLDFIHAMPVMGGREVFYVKLCNGAVALNELESIPDFNFYPVPFSDELIISGTNGIGELVIYDITGKEVLRQQTVEGQSEIFTGDLQHGLYLIRIVSGERSLVWKVIKN